MNEIKTNNQIKKRSWWFYGVACLAILVLLAIAVMPLVQNYRAIPQISNSPDIYYELKPGLLLRSLPSSWQDWFDENLEPELLHPFQIITTISVKDPSDLDKYFYMKKMTDLELLEMSNSAITDTEMAHLKNSSTWKNSI